MLWKERVINVYKTFDEKFFHQFGFKLRNISFNNIVEYLHRPKDSSSLAVTRILFGLCMLFDIPDERGGSQMDKRWGDPKTCHFPLLPFLTAVPMPYMALVYTYLWFGALGIMLGYKYRLSVITFTVCYWYLLLIEKSFWNNHSYLFGLVAFLLCFSSAHCYWSIDAYMNSKIKSETVPYWNYFLLKYQFFILYFMAGLKKGTAEWLTGYSVQRLSEHWVFDPFKFLLSVEQIDHIIVHWFIFIFDLTIAIWMMLASTRNVAMIFCALFHLMNCRLFTIGMFPWVCLATMPLFYPFDWPKLLMKFIRHFYYKAKTTIKDGLRQLKYTVRFLDNSEEETKDVSQYIPNDKESKNGEELLYKVLRDNEEILISKDIDNDFLDFDDYHSEGNVQSDPFENKENTSPNCFEMLTTVLIILYILLQLLLPFSHFVTKGYNNWTNGLYGYSWDMMVHTWDSQSAIVKVVDNDKNTVVYVDPYYYTLNERWTRHGDMVYQYSLCLNDRILNSRKENNISQNISVYIDMWCSLNGRFTQRMFNPKVDILKAKWSPFQPIPFLMPLLDEALHWRSDLNAIETEVHTWNNFSDVLFYADFPGFDHEKYIPDNLENVTLTVLEGKIAIEHNQPNFGGQSFKMVSGDQEKVLPGSFHKVINIGNEPAFYMYTFINGTEIRNSKVLEKTKALSEKLPIGKEFKIRIQKLFVFVNLLGENLYKLFFRMSM